MQFQNLAAIFPFRFTVRNSSVSISGSKLNVLGRMTPATLWRFILSLIKCFTAVPTHRIATRRSMANRNEQHQFEIKSAIIEGDDDNREIVFERVIRAWSGWGSLRAREAHYTKQKMFCLEIFFENFWLQISMKYNGLHVYMLTSLTGWDTLLCFQINQVFT